MTASTTVSRKNSLTRKPADFQTAIAATKFGLFNILLTLACIPAGFSLQYESALFSFIAPAAACDLGIDATSSGLINSMPFIGMVTSGLFTGFVIDTLGRKKFLSLGFFVVTLMVLAQASSPNKVVLSVFKYFTGFITGGLYVALTTYNLEFLSNEYRGRFQMILGSIYAAAAISMPVLASFILPMKISGSIGYLDFHPWNLLTLGTGIYPLIAAIVFCFLPETPKFLMSIGKNEEALEVMSMVYSLNTRNPKETYPIRSLIDEIEDKDGVASRQTCFKDYLKSGWLQISPLFGKSHRTSLLLVSLVSGLIMMSQNAIRLYLPQVFQATHDYKIATNKTDASLCEILEVLRNSHETDGEITCSVNLENSFEVYFASIIIATVTFVGYLISGTMINIFGRKQLIGVLGFIATLEILCTPFSPNTTVTLVFSATSLTGTGICFDMFATLLMVCFPTQLRAMAMSISLLAGRGLTVAGNNIMPLLVGIGCLPPYTFFGLTFLCAVGLIFLLPVTGNEDMK